MVMRWFMTWVQVGAVSINLERVNRIRDYSKTDASGQTIPGPMRLIFEGGDFLDLTTGADLMRNWLSTNAQSLQTS